MYDTRAHLSSRLSIRAIFSAVFSTFAVMSLLMLLTGVFRLWMFDSYIQRESFIAWTVAFTAWAFSTYVGGYIASIVSRSVTERDGKLHGFITWATVSILGCLLFGFMTFDPFESLQLAPPFLLLGVFLAGAFALGTALLGGMKGAQSEKRLISQEEKKALDQKLEPAFSH